MISTELFSLPFEEQQIPINDERSFMLRSALERAVSAQPAEALLLSGGIDSAFLSALDPRVPAVTVVIENQGVDLQNAQKVAEYVGAQWYPVEISEEQALKSLRDIIELTHSYDPALLNDIPVYEGIKYAASRGWRNIRTGDAADTLFGGYTYLRQDVDFQSYLRKLIPHISLASSRIGRAMGVHMHYPYLHPEVLTVALQTDFSENVAFLKTEQEGDFVEKFDKTVQTTRRWGKIVLRKAAQGLLPSSTIWRTKADLEFGSGTYRLEDGLRGKISDHDVTALQATGKHFWNRMHASIFQIYEELGLEPNAPTEQEYACGWCGGGVQEGRRHCHTCGAYPADQQKLFLFENETI